MSDNNKRGRLTLILLVLFSLTPFVLGYVVFKGPEFLQPAKTVHKGELIAPPIPLFPMTPEEEIQFSIDGPQMVPMGAFSEIWQDELKGHWVMFQVVTAEHGCHALCKKTLHATRQIRLMLNKDIARIRRVIVVDSGISEDQAMAFRAFNENQHQQDEDKYLLQMRPGDQLMTLLTSAVGGPLQQGMVFLMDPLGNVMMWYPPNFNPYDVKKDLKRLLSVSPLRKL